MMRIGLFLLTNLAVLVVAGHQYARDCVDGLPDRHESAFYFK
jgi:hypothetical protein